MFKNRRYLKPRIQKACQEFNHVLDEATLLVEALVLQQSGSNLDKFKNMNFKKASIDSLNDIIVTLKNIVKSNLHFLDESIDYENEENFSKIQTDHEFTNIIQYILRLNLISDNNDVTLYLAPYIDNWDLLTAGVRVVILSQVIRSINNEIQRSQLAEKISKKF
ncbi:MAG: hypothetical protein EAX90_13285 [Candidatus Heimdallarchaeota archaeon]|nr:hypothetical protein [Candidatus Heimdallarchaeota archaeon]